MTPSDLSGTAAFEGAIATALAAASLPDAPLAMPEQRLDPVHPFGALRALLAAPRRRAEP
ncbi:MAG: hypothetical protein F9K34_15850 [Albidovulum sp.]|uniref:hypothetical protein n=1 Tax=Albidovulum sp. TaxID=1872424 RepID=UPI001320CDDE|nr:hypothetical protein [Defluviimonas sp.]KAB2881853.1 MAG: hypothetical protein F9K34_15850 [Defluviimonas sp.]